MSEVKPKKEKKKSKRRSSKKLKAKLESSPSQNSLPETNSLSENTADPSQLTTTPSVSDLSVAEFEEQEAVDADALLDEKGNSETLTKIQEEAAKLDEPEEKKNLRKLMTLKTMDKESVKPETWFEMRECFLLTLESRMLLRQMVEFKMKQERLRRGDLSVDEIQNLVRSQKEEQETDWITEIQELKRNLINEIRRNHVMERDLAKLDKRIALLIKNRGNIQEEIIKKEGQKSVKNTGGEKFELGQRKLEHYQNLFYLLQTEPKYLAQLVYLMQAEQMDAFLDTVILTLYGDAFSPREEYLILKLFQLSIQKEMSAIKNVSEFLSADSVVPKMVITYNRRKQGSEFLKNILGPLINEVVDKDLNFEMRPHNIFNAMINEEEINKGEKSHLDRNLSDEQIMELEEVKRLLEARVVELESICQTFFDGILKSLKKVPYGIRWICKQIRRIAEKNFSGEASDDDIFKVIGYFVYYRFINLAIVTPDSFDIIDSNSVHQMARRNLVAVAKVLQNLFNLSKFTTSTDRWMTPMNDWIERNVGSVRDYFTDLIEVPEPEDYLQVDKYMELTQKTKPVIIISLKEIAQTHAILLQNIDKMVKEPEDALRTILNDLGDAPTILREDDREIQLTLTNRFKQTMEEEISANATTYAETKELVINAFKQIPIQGKSSEQTLVSILSYGKQFADENKNSSLLNQIDKIFENLKILEGENLVSSKDNYASFLRDIALEVANRAEIREQQRKEIKRLSQALRNLRKHQKYLDDQIQQYNAYLQDCKLQHYQPKKKKKGKKGQSANKIGPFKFSYKALQKKGVIIDSDVSSAVRGKTYFMISSEAVGVFDIVAKIGSLPVEKMTLEFDDLLERNYNNITRLELDQVTLDVNMMIHLLNKFFMKK